MFKKLKKFIFNFFLSDNNKPKILIFGASKGGAAAYNNIHLKYKVVGFVDNNSKIHGEKIFNKSIYAPSEIQKLAVDKIIIASDYYIEIYKQLTDELSIKADVISIFHFPLSQQRSFTVSFFNYYNLFVTSLLCNHPLIFSRKLLCLLSCVSKKYRTISIKRNTWLDLLDRHKIKIFYPQQEKEYSSPHFVNEEVIVKLMIVPEVALYRFDHGGIMANVNAVSFGRDDIAIGRVPTFPVNKSQYNASFLMAHGTNNALLKKHHTISLKSGVAIVGSGDTNYYHWVIEVLCKLQFIADLPKEFKDFPILISEQAKKIPSIKNFIECLNITQSITYLQSNIYYEVDDLLYISPANYLVPNLKEKVKYTIESNFTRFDSLYFLRNNILKKVADDKNITFASRVFLARKGYIRGYNQDEVYGVLEAYGFKDIYLEDYSLLEQVQIMNNADIIIGPTGAAWTNLIFCKPYTLALCWMAEEYGELACFSDLAQFSQVDLEYLRYKVGARSTNELYYSEYSIDINKIKQWLFVKGIRK